MDQKIVLLWVLKFKRVDISDSYIYLFVLKPKFFLLISFSFRFSRMFLFYVFS